MTVPGEEWTDCEPGQLRQLTDQLQSTRQKQSLRRQFAMATATLLVACCVGVFAFERAGDDSDMGRITCREVMDLADRFVNGELDTTIIRRIENHLHGCNSCRVHVEQLQQPALTTTSHYHQGSQTVSVVASR